MTKFSVMTLDRTFVGAGLMNGLEWSIRDLVRIFSMSLLNLSFFFLSEFKLFQNILSPDYYSLWCSN